MIITEFFNSEFFEPWAESHWKGLAVAYADWRGWDEAHLSHLDTKG